MDDSQKTDLLGKIAEVRASIIKAHGNEPKPEWMRGPFEPHSSNHTSTEAVAHALWCLGRATSILERLQPRQDAQLAYVGAALCLGVACGVVLPFGITASYKIPLFDVYPALNLPS